MKRFDSARLLLERYYEGLLFRGASDRGQHLLQEIRGRLRQLQWMHRRLLAIEDQLVEQHRSENPVPEHAHVFLIFTDIGIPVPGTLIQASLEPTAPDEMRAVLESFYYSAHRIRDILRDNKSDLPGLKSFEAVGVRDVRNHLVEHPTRKSGVIVPSIKCGGPVGPQLKPLRFSNDAEGTMDKGLHENCREFLENLERVLSAAIDARGK